MRVYIYVCNRTYGPFIFLSPYVRFCKWSMIFGDNVSRSGSWQKERRMLLRSMSYVSLALSVW